MARGKERTSKVGSATRPRSRTSRHKTFRPRWGLGAVFLFVVLVASAVGLRFEQADAASYISPELPAPLGNLPVTIWNRHPLIMTNNPSLPEKQEDAVINIDGTLSFGSIDLELGGDPTSSNNLLEGVSLFYDYNGTPDSLDDITYMDEDDYLIRMREAFMNHPVDGDMLYDRFTVNRYGSVYSAGSVTAAGMMSLGSQGTLMSNGALGTPDDYMLRITGRFDESAAPETKADPNADWLLWLRTYDDIAGAYTERVQVDMEGNVWARGSVDSDGCFGAVFVGLSSSTYRPSQVSGYYGAHNACRSSYAGSHVCTSHEVLESIRCSEPGSPIRAVPDNSQGWVHGGPPGYTADTNDCLGWQVGDVVELQQNSYGRFWIFNQTSGGKGTAASCNATAKAFACCR